jgi:hypothetical protein
LVVLLVVHLLPVDKWVRMPYGWTQCTPIAAKLNYVLTDGDWMTQDLKRGDIWTQANSLEDLGEATARWLEGRISYPFNGEDADPETTNLVQHLAL